MLRPTLKLTFSKGKSNAKLKKYRGLYLYSLPAGEACPFAKICRSRVTKEGRIEDGPDTEWRCMGASTEVRYPFLQAMVRNNWKIVRGVGVNNREGLAELFNASLPKDAKYIRIHGTGGDYQSENYMLAWIDVAKKNPGILFYGYTKALPFLVKLRRRIPSNMRLSASRGGTHDHLIDKHNLVEARVVFHPDEADKLGWEIDHDDSHAMKADKSFCLLLHATQPAGSMAAKALANMRREGVNFGYTHIT